jgi:hypothetical protein
MLIQVEVFWVVTPCNGVVRYQHSEDLAANIFTLEDGVINNTYTF